MDNITHTLIGIAGAEPLALRRPARDRARLWVASAVANNLPDLDVLYTFGAKDPLTYLLHHRGHSHTLLLAPVLAGLWLALLRLWWWKRDDIPWRAVAALVFLGPLLHLFADSWNTYGVHPFWPLDDRWYYGDLVFIVEPWLWAILLPVVWRRAGTRVGRALPLLLAALMTWLVWTHPYVPWPVALAVSGTATLWLLAQRLVRSDHARISAAFAAIAALFGAFAWGSIGLHHAFAGEGTEVAALPDPGDPFCWTVLAAGFRGAEYRAAAWTAAPWPALVPATSCRPMLRAGPQAGLAPLPEPPSSRRVPLGAFIASRASYDELAKSCRARAYLRFARIPYWKRVDGQLQLGDLRFDGGFRFGVSGASGDDCPPFEPPWLGRFYPPEASPASP